MMLLDVNVLVYAFRAESSRHQEWRDWLTGACAAPFHVPDEVAVGFVRIVTNHRIFAAPDTVSDARAFLEVLRAAPGWRGLHRRSEAWGVFDRLCAATSLRGASVHDGWLAALTIDQGASLVSADRDFARFPGLVWVNPVGEGRVGER